MITEFEIDARAQGDGLPVETFTIEADLTGHTIHMVIEGLGEIAGDYTVTRAAGTNGADDPGASDVTYTPTAEIIAAAPGRYRVSIVVDMTNPTLKETVGASWWPVVDLPG